MYTVRETYKDIFEVSKFSDYREPDSVYYIRKNKCSCPASYRSKKCKHQALVELYKALPKEDHFYVYDLSDSGVASVSNVY